MVIAVQQGSSVINITKTKTYGNLLQAKPSFGTVRGGSSYQAWVVVLLIYICIQKISPQHQNTRIPQPETIYMERE